MKYTRGLNQSPLLSGLVCCIASALLVAGLWRGGYLEALELKAYDQGLRLRPSLAANDNIVLLTIGESDIQRWGRWPLDDATLAAVLERLQTEQHPLAIGLDLYRDIAIAPGSDALNAVLHQYSNIIATYKWGGTPDRRIGAPPALRGSDRLGFNDIIVDDDGITRRALLYLREGEEMVPSFALLVALRYLQSYGIFPAADTAHAGYLRLGNTAFTPLTPESGAYQGADTGGYQFLLDYRDRRDAFASHSMSDLLAGGIAPDAFRGRIVLIGTDAQSVKDFFYLPTDPADKPHGKTTGLGMHALIASQLLRTAIDGGRPNPSLPEPVEALWALAWIAAGSLLGYRALSAWGLPLFWLSGTTVIVGSGFLTLAVGYWLPVVLPVAGWSVAFAAMSAYAAIREKRHKTHAMRLFGQFVAPEVAQAIWEKREQILQGVPLQPTTTTATVLFSDLLGFTAIMEKLDPPQGVAWLEDYLNVMADCVHAHGGVVVRFVGDAIMAVFGIPDNIGGETDTAEPAAACALAMDSKMIELNCKWRSQNLPVTGMRIGINTGTVQAGSLGTASRREFAVHGDTVNIAARLEQLHKHTFEPDFFRSPSRILIGETTAAALDSRFTLQAWGSFQLRGKGRALSVFELIAGQDEA